MPGKSNQNDAWYSQPLGWRATQCCSAYALQSSVFNCGGIIARPFVFCNRSDEHFFVQVVNCRYVPTIQKIFLKKPIIYSYRLDKSCIIWYNQFCNQWYIWGAVMQALIKQIRTYLKMSQTEFAEHMNVRYLTVNRWENGHPQQWACRRDFAEVHQLRRTHRHLRWLFPLHQQAAERLHLWKQ